MIKIHLDTDLGGDIDDLCALAFVLSHPGVQLVGVTTVADENGRRAGYARYALGLAGASSVPVAAGADVSLGRFRFRPGYPPHERYWPEPIPTAPGPLDAALDLLQSAISEDAVIVGIGPFTNLALLERRTPGALSALGPGGLVLMGGHVRPVPDGFPQWSSDEGDYNVQLDVAAARMVLERARPTLVPIEATVQTALRRVHLTSLRRAGALGELVARQAEACALDWRNEERYGQTCTGLPDDAITFLHDPLACAAAVGWEGVEIETLPLALHEAGATLHQRVAPRGRETRVVTRVDGAAFSDRWCATLVEAAERRAAGERGPGQHAP
jgi:inosine-uridine nucleoside N-ribohydrolase